MKQYYGYGTSNKKFRSKLNKLLNQKHHFNLILYIMFRSNQYCSRYEETLIQLDTPIIIPGNDARQNKRCYHFTVNDRSSYFDWFNGFFEVKFSVNQFDGGGGYNDIADDKIATMVNGSTSLINNLNIKQNCKVFYEGNNLFLNTYVKSLIEFSEDYARSLQVTISLT